MNDDRKYWRITYLPAKAKPGEVEWMFWGNKDELNEYLTLKHACEACRGETWWNSSCSHEYDITELLEW